MVLQEHSPLVCACHHELRGAPRRLSFVLLECSFLALLQLPASIYGMRSACAALDPSTTILLLASSRQPLYIRVTIRPRAHPRLMQWSGRWCGHHYDLFRLGITPETTELVSPRWRRKEGGSEEALLRNTAMAPPVRSQMASTGRNLPDSRNSILTTWVWPANKAHE